MIIRFLKKLFFRSVEATESPEEMPLIEKVAIRTNVVTVQAGSTRIEATVLDVEESFSVLEGNCYVVDGDTIRIGIQPIRLFGIDAPELEHPYGKLAKSKLLQLCKGQKIKAVLTEDRTYERIVAKCYLPDGRDLSEEMVKLGLALDWPKFSGGIYRKFEPADVRKKLWRCEARQRGKLRMDS
ncbi:thermonuclease family protein [Marivivens sp. LCG002]|uniref:thermonuclease family protein n=1 Tax=Marivivens sp. LCG002 TaxID=3051171 RepID=UPI002554C9CC|nr:thermonuclease family protein [Marivivens sp. LCG002]WIV50479.1 thermonuclease family protein [Marivivens sp. LCG002]